MSPRFPDFLHTAFPALNPGTEAVAKETVKVGKSPILMLREKGSCTRLFP